MMTTRCLLGILAAVMLTVPAHALDPLPSPPPIPDLTENLKPAMDQKAVTPKVPVPAQAPPGSTIQPAPKPPLPTPEKNVIKETVPQPQTGKKVLPGTEPVIVSRLVRNLKEGKEGEEAEVVLKGRNLLGVTTATAAGVRATIVTRTPTEMTLKLAGGGLSTMNLTLRLTAFGKPLDVPLGEEIRKARAEAARTRTALPERGAVPKPEAGAGAMRGSTVGADSGAKPEAVAQPGGRVGGSAPKYDPESDEFRFSSGHRIPGTDRSGSRGKVNEKGDVEYSQGSIVSHDPETGSTTIIYSDGRTVTHHRDGKDTVRDRRSGASIQFGKHSDSANVRSDPKYNRDTDTFDFGDGTKIKATDGKGERGKITDRGDIQYSDGTLVTHDDGTGETTVIHPDGSTSTYYDDDTSFTRRDRGGRGPAYDPGSDTFVYGDGTKITARDAQGRLSSINDKGDIVGADGTIITHDERTGSVTIVHPDGSSTMYGRDQETGTRAFFGDHGDSSFQQGADKTYSTDGGNIISIEHPDGSRDVRDRKTGVTIHFGDHGDSQSVQGGNKDDGKSGGSSPGSRGSGGTSSSKGSSGSRGSGGSTSGKKGADTSKDSTKHTGKDTTKDGSGKDGGSKDGGTKDGGDKPDGGKDGGAKEIGVGGTAVSGPSSTAGTKIEDRKNMTRRRDDGGGSGGSQPCEPGSQPVPGEECTREGDPDRPEVEEREVGLPHDASAESTKYNPADPDRFRDGSGMGGRTIDPFDRMPVINPNP